MTQTAAKQSGEDLEDDIARIAAPHERTATPRAAYLNEWEKFVRGLQKAGIGAAVRLSEDGVRYHLVLWPQYRPGWRSLMLTFRIDPSSIVLFGSAAETLRSPDELAGWLRSFARQDAFQDTLQLLREQASSPVDARLELPGGSRLLVAVSAEDQRRLYQASAVLDLEIQLDEGEPLPRPGPGGVLRSAGVELDVLDITIPAARTLGLQVRSRAPSTRANG